MALCRRIGVGVLALGVGVGVGVVAGVASPAWAQDAAPLEGPKVRVRAVPGVRTEYVPGEVGGIGARERLTPLPVFFDAIRGLEAAGTPQAEQLTSSQRERLRLEIGAFAEDVRDYLGSVRPEVETLLAQLGQADQRRARRELDGVERLARTAACLLKGGEGGSEEGVGGGVGGESTRISRTPRETAEAFRLRFSGPPAREGGAAVEMGSMGMGGEGEAARAEVLARLAEIRGAAPSPADLQVRVWGLLSEAQRERVGGAIEAYRDQMRAEQEEARLARMLAQRAGGSEGSPASGVADSARKFDDAAIRRITDSFRAGEFPEPLWSRLPDRARVRLEGLNPEQRAEAVERLLRERGFGASSPKS